MVHLWQKHYPPVAIIPVVTLLILLAGLALMLPPIPQPSAYHDFADQRASGALPNFLDTVSNALFVLAGALGLLFLRGEHRRRAFLDAREAWPYVLFFIAVILTGFASGYYHLAPDNARLVWDRAAIALAFMAWFSAIVCERVSLKVGLMLLLPLLLRLYPPRYSAGRDILAVIGLYLLALLFDLTDRPVFALTGGLVGGHTIKHAIAALAAVWVARYLRRRRPLCSRPCAPM